MYFVPPPVACLPAAAIILIGCGLFFKNPQIVVREVALRSFSLKELALDVTLDVDNPNMFGITMKTISFDLSFLSGEDPVHLTGGRISRTRINKGKNPVRIPVAIGNAVLLQALMNMIIDGSIRLRIEGTACPDLLLAAPEIPFAKEVAVPLPGRNPQN